MCKHTWQEYNREKSNLFLDQESLRPPSKIKKKRGRPRIFTHPLFQLLHIFKIQYRMTYRTLEGFAKSMLPLLQKDLVLPTYSLICKEHLSWKKPYPNYLGEGRR